MSCWPIFWLSTIIVITYYIAQLFENKDIEGGIYLIFLIGILSNWNGLDNIVTWVVMIGCICTFYLITLLNRKNKNE